MAPKKKSPGLAVVLSLIPGLGHLYAGEAGKGVLLFLATALGGFLMIVLPGIQLAFSSMNEMWTSSFDPFTAHAAVVITAPLYVLVIGPALVIYSMASSHRSVVQHNEAVDAAYDAADGLAPVGAAAGAPAAAPVASATSTAVGTAGATGATMPAGHGQAGHGGDWLITDGQAYVWGAILAALGAVLVLPPLFPGLFVSASRLWPLLLVVVGGAVIWGAAGSGRFGRGK